MNRGIESLEEMQLSEADAKAIGRKMTEAERLRRQWLDKPHPVRYDFDRQSGILLIAITAPPVRR